MKIYQAFQKKARSSQWSIVLFTTGVILILMMLSTDFIVGKEEYSIGRVQWLGIIIGFVLLLSSVLIAVPRMLQLGLTVIRVISLGLFILGTILLVINLYGMFVSIRSPLIQVGNEYAGIYRIPKYTADEVIAKVDKYPEESSQEYAHRLTKLIYDGVIHYWGNQYVDDLNLRIPIHENFILYFQSYIDPIYFRTYEYFDSTRAIERGASICSQASKILVDILNANGFPAYEYVLDGHVVAIGKLGPPESPWWVLDADYGVVIEQPIHKIEGNPEMVLSNYIAAGYEAKSIEYVVEAFGPEGNYKATSYQDIRQETLYYQYKWALPILAMLPYLLILFSKRINLSQKKQNHINRPE